MLVKEAIKCFGILESDLVSLSDRQLKKIYISLIKMNHPDLAYSDGDTSRNEEITQTINVAYEVLVKYRKELLASGYMGIRGSRNRTPPNDYILITLDEIMAIRSGVKIEKGLCGSGVVLDKITLNKYKVIVDIPYRYCVGDKWFSGKESVACNAKDIYSIKLVINTYSDNDNNIKISISNQDKSIKMCSRYSTVTFSLDNFITVSFELERLCNNG